MSIDFGLRYRIKLSLPGLKGYNPILVLATYVACCETNTFELHISNNLSGAIRHKAGSQSRSQDHRGNGLDGSKEFFDRWLLALLFILTFGPPQRSALRECEYAHLNAERTQLRDPTCCGGKAKLLASVVYALHT
jgi:hypothetical protein